MQAHERERRDRRDWLVILLILALGLLFILLASGWALRFSPRWELTADMQSNLDPNRDFLTRRPGGFIEALDPAILTHPAWYDVYLTPGATIPASTGVPATSAASSSTQTALATSTQAVTATAQVSTGTAAVTTTANATNTTVYYPPPSSSTPQSNPAATQTPTTAAPTATSTSTSNPAFTATPTPTVTQTPTSTPTTNPAFTSTPTPTATQTSTSTPTSTPTATQASTATSTPTSTPTSTATNTSTSTATYTPTVSATPSPTNTPTPTPTNVSLAMRCFTSPVTIGASGTYSVSAGGACFRYPDPGFVYGGVFTIQEMSATSGNLTWYGKINPTDLTCSTYPRSVSLPASGSASIAVRKIFGYMYVEVTGTTSVQIDIVDWADTGCL